MKELNKAETKYGMVTITPTSGTHIHVSDLEVARVRQGLTVNGMGIYIGAHMHLWNDGLWHMGAQFNKKGENIPDYERRMFLYTTHIGFGLKKDVTEAARRKLIEELCEVVNEWARNHVAVIIEADFDDLTNQMQALTEELFGLKKQMQEKEEQWNGLKALRDAKEKALTNPTLEKE